MKLGEFFISLVVDAQQGELTVKRLVSSIGDLEAITVGQIGALFMLGNALAEITDLHVKAALGIGETSRELDISSEALQRWENVAKMSASQGAITNIDAMLKSAAKMVTDWRIGLVPTDKLNVFRWLGIDLASIKEGHSDDIIRQIRQSVQRGVTMHGQRLTRIEVQRLIDQLGSEFGQSSEMFFGMNKGGFEKAYASAPIKTEADIKAARELTREFGEIHNIAERIGNKITSWTAPVLVELLKDFEKLMAKDVPKAEHWWSKFDVEKATSLEKAHPLDDARSIIKYLLSEPLAKKDIFGTRFDSEMVAMENKIRAAGGDVGGQRHEVTGTVTVGLHGTAVAELHEKSKAQIEEHEKKQNQRANAQTGGGYN